MKRRLRALAAAFTLLLFAAGAVHAQPFYERNPAAGLFGSLWSWAASHLGFLNKEGGDMDPGGIRSCGLGRGRVRAAPFAPATPCP